MDVMAQVASFPDALEFEVNIDSTGGYVDVAYDIYDYLTTIGKPITTKAINNCMSAATIVFMAGSKRIPFCDLMIHNPWVGGVEGDADYLLQVADDVRATEDRLINTYSKITGQQKVAIDALMRKETYISPEMALSLGFATEIPERVKPLAKFKQKENMNAITKKLDEILAKINKKQPVKNLSATLEGGEVVEISNADGTDISGMPAVGNIVTLGGEPAPDGTHVIPELSISIVTASGVITEVITVSVNMEELDSLKSENLNLKRENEELKNQISEFNSKVEGIENALKLMEGKEVELPKAKASFRQEPKELSFKEKIEAKRKEKLTN